MTPDEIARVICAEKCAYYGDPPCFSLEEDGGRVPWPNENCDEPGCMALATAVAAALAAGDPDHG